MDLSKKKKLAKKTFRVGSDRIVFVQSRLGEIKDAITKQDLRDLEKSGAIIIKVRKGRKSLGRRRARRKSRSTGNIRKKVRQNKKDYMAITRKLRGYLLELYSRNEISREDLGSMRKKIRNREFRSKTHFKELISPRTPGGTK